MMTIDDLPDTGIISVGRYWQDAIQCLMFSGKYVTVWLLYIIEGVAYIFVDSERG